MNWAALWDIVWRIIVSIGDAYALYVIWVKVPRLERNLKDARATIRGYLTARAERTPQVRK